MHPAVDYVRANAGTYDRRILDDQLRRAGYDERTIAEAWNVVGTHPAWPIVGTPDGGVAQHRVLVMHKDAMPKPFPAWAIALVTLVIAVSLGLGGLMLLGERTSSLSSSDTELQDQIVEDTSDDLGFSESEQELLTDSLGGATHEGSLPDGWTRSGDGIWIDEVTGNNVNVLSFPSSASSDPEAELRKAADDYRARFDRVEGFDVISDTTFDGHDALRHGGTVSARGMELDMTQWVVELGDDIVVVTATSGADEADEVDDVIDGLRLT